MALLLFTGNSSSKASWILTMRKLAARLTCRNYGRLFLRITPQVLTGRRPTSRGVFSTLLGCMQEINNGRSACLVEETGVWKVAKTR
jgi:hypothetical protein